MREAITIIQMWRGVEQVSIYTHKTPRKLLSVPHCFLFFFFSFLSVSEWASTFPLLVLCPFHCLKPSTFPFLFRLEPFGICRGEEYLSSTVSSWIYCSQSHIPPPSHNKGECHQSLFS